jgi:hypothetical protein
MRLSDPNPSTVEFLNGKQVGKSLREIAVDLIKTESEDLVSRWYHGTSNTDLFTWADRCDNIIKQQLNVNGQVVEWNCLEGVKTGVVIELDMENKETPENKVGTSESIQFDSKPQGYSVTLALEILANVDMDVKLREQLIGNFRNPQNIDSMTPEAFMKRFGLALKNYEKQDSGFWRNLKTRFTAIFNRQRS